MHLSACVLQQVDPFSLVGPNAGPATGTYQSERYLDGASRDSVGYSDPAGAGSQCPAAQMIPLPSFDKPRCVSGKLSGGLWYIRAILPNVDMPPVHCGGRGTSERHNGGVSDDDGGGGEGGGNADDRSTKKTFTTGAITIGGGIDKGKGFGGEVTGEYCIVRVDSLDQVCDLIYCGQGAVEAKNLSKIVGMQLGYLQASVRNREGCCRIQRPTVRVC